MRQDQGRSWRAERRSVARRHHPDLGGDLDTYLALVAEVDRRHGRRRAGTTSDPTATTRFDVVTERGFRVTWNRRTRRAVRRVRGAVRAARARLPAGAPGRRRYTTLQTAAPGPTRPPSDTDSPHTFSKEQQ